MAYSLARETRIRTHGDGVVSVDVTGAARTRPVLALRDYRGRLVDEYQIRERRAAEHKLRDLNRDKETYEQRHRHCVDYWCVQRHEHGRR